jgi:hypothetical protein
MRSTKRKTAHDIVIIDLSKYSKVRYMFSAIKNILFIKSNRSKQSQNIADSVQFKI